MIRETRKQKAQEIINKQKVILDGTWRNQEHWHISGSDIQIIVTNKEIIDLDHPKNRRFEDIYSCTCKDCSVNSVNLKDTKRCCYTKAVQIIKEKIKERV